MTTTPDITIIGGGIIGLLTARAFINAGASVAIIEQYELGRESSWAGGGILLPLYPWRQAEAISRLVMRSLTLYPVLASQLAAETLIDPEWTPCGLLIAKNPDSAAAFAWCAANAVLCHPADAGLFGSLKTTTNQPLWLPGIAQARNPRLLKSLKQDLINKHATLMEHCTLQDIVIHNSRITAINTTSGRLPINHLVIAAGAWTGQLFDRLFPAAVGDTPKIAPIKGQMLLFDSPPETLKFMVLDGDHYLIPRRDGKILAGSTVEQAGFDKSTTAQARDHLHAFATALLPSLGDAPPALHWAGLRPGTGQGIPYIDRHPELRNCWINAGHFRNGLAMGPASAQLMVDLILERPTEVDLQPYKLSSLH